MVRIAICDDKDLHTRMLAGMICCWAKEKYLKLQLEIFRSGEEILCATEENGSFFVVFMDIRLKGLSGIETARRLRQMDRYVNIVFVSQYDGYFRQMFEIYPCYYIEKPISEKKLVAILERIMEEHKYIYAIYPFCYRRRNYRIFLRKVLYFCSERRKIRIMTEGETEYFFYKKLDVVEQQLKEYEVDFIRIHQSFLVNGRQVEQFYSDHVMMSNGERLAVSRERRENVNCFIRRQ